MNRPERGVAQNATKGRRKGVAPKTMKKKAVQRTPRGICFGMLRPARRTGWPASKNRAKDSALACHFESFLQSFVRTPAHHTAQHDMNSPDQPTQPERRQFIAKAAAVGIGAAATAVPMLAGLATVLDPLRRKSAAGGPVFVTTLNALSADGVPQRFQIIADREDVWNKFPRVPVGAVYLRRIGNDKVEALNVTCPHAGCPVEFKTSTSSFLCPCHDSTFKLDGSLASASSPSPRGLDTLEAEVRHGSEVWVRFQNFEAGKAKKIPLT